MTRQSTVQYNEDGTVNVSITFDLEPLKLLKSIVRSGELVKNNARESSENILRGLAKCQRLADQITVTMERQLKDKPR